MRLFMKNYFGSFQKAFLILLIGMSVWIIPGSATVFVEDGKELTIDDLYEMVNTTKPANNSAPVVFFYDPECGPCIPVHEYLEKYISDHPVVEVEMVNLSAGPESEAMMSDLYIQHNRSMMNTPVIFYGPVGLEGTDEIINGFEMVYRWYTTEDCNCQSLTS